MMETTIGREVDDRCIDTICFHNPKSPFKIRNPELFAELWKLYWGYHDLLIARQYMEKQDNAETTNLYKEIDTMLPAF